MSNADITDMIANINSDRHTLIHLLSFKVEHLKRIVQGAFSSRE